MAKLPKSYVEKFVQTKGHATFKNDIKEIEEEKERELREKRAKIFLLTSLKTSMKSEDVKLVGFQLPVWINDWLDENTGNKSHFVSEVLKQAIGYIEDDTR